jgi:hypothetical protein
LGFVCPGLIFIPELALLTLSDKSVCDYHGVWLRYLKFCDANFYSDPMCCAAIEGFIFQNWKKGNSKASPEQFRSVLRKAAKVRNMGDPVSPRAELMILGFGVVEPPKVKKYIEIEEWKRLLKTVLEGKKKSWCFLLKLLEFCVWQNVRIGTLVEIKFNDVCEDGCIYLAKVKGHRSPIWSILHPIAEMIVNELRDGMKVEPNDLIVGEWSEKRLNEELKALCIAAGVCHRTWHVTKHTCAQYMNDLGYPMPLMQALGCWKDAKSSRYYILDRVGVKFAKDVKTAHKGYCVTLSERLLRHKGIMVWLPPACSGKRRRQAV